MFRLLGAIDLDRILRTKRAVKIEEIMHETRHAIPATMDQEEAAREFEQYDLLSAAVVDENERLVGVLTIENIVDVIQEEAEEDIMRMGGVGDEELSDSVLSTSRSRMPWLLVNLFTAFLSASVIGLFDATIQQMVALAVLMPIVASHGRQCRHPDDDGDRARARDTRHGYLQRRPHHPPRSMVGLINGVIFAIMIGMVAGPLVRKRQSRRYHRRGDGYQYACRGAWRNPDSACCSTSFWCRSGHRVGRIRHHDVTDVVGFFAFLGLATWWFGFK